MNLNNKTIILGLPQFKDIFPDYATFKTKVIDPSKSALGDNITWLTDSNKFYKLEAVYLFLSNAFKVRYTRYQEEEFLGYFMNGFIQYTPMFYARVSGIIEDKIKDLQVNENVGKKTTVTSNSKRGESTTPYNNNLVSTQVAQDNIEQNQYNMETNSANIIDNALKLSQAAVNGEIDQYVHSFDDLFTQIDMSKEINCVIRDNLLAALKAVAELSKDSGIKVDTFAAKLDELLSHLIPGPVGPEGPVGPAGPQGIQGIQGERGEQGLPGKSFTPKGTVATAADLPQVAQTDDAYVTVDLEHMWIYDGNAWVDMGRFQGAQGQKGDKGDTGVQGPVGPQGPKGDTGQVTDADKAAITQSARDYADAKYTALHTTITTEQSSKIKYYSGQIAIFNTEKVAPSKFADTTLFDKYEVPLGAALLGGNTKTLVNGEVLSHAHNTGIKNDLKLNTTANTSGSYDINISLTSPSTGKANIGWDGTGHITLTNSGNDITTQATGGTQNKAYGLQIISHIYIAKKDITFAEMGE